MEQTKLLSVIFFFFGGGGGDIYTWRSYTWSTREGSMGGEGLPLEFTVSQEWTE